MDVNDVRMRRPTLHMFTALHKKASEEHEQVWFERRFLGRFL